MMMTMVSLNGGPGRRTAIVDSQISSELKERLGSSWRWQRVAEDVGSFRTGI